MSVWAIKQVPGQSRPHRETLAQKTHTQILSLLPEAVGCLTGALANRQQWLLPGPRSALAAGSGSGLQ